MQTAQHTVELQEWQETFLPGIVLSKGDRRLSETLTGVEIREMREGIYIQASSWVGVVRFEAFTLRIQPKLSHIDVMRMLLAAGGLDRLRRYRSIRQYDLADDLSLFDLLAALLNDACTILARDGLLRGYVLEENDLPVIRGRLRVGDQIRHRYGQINRLECRYDDHHADIPENRILLTVLLLCRRYVQHPVLRTRVNQMADLFAAVCRPLQLDWRQVRAEFTYNRLNAHYREAHTLAWIMLEGLGVDDVSVSGPLSGFAFLLDMNPLFESFIALVVRAAMRGPDVTVHSQKRTGGHIWDIDRQRTYTHIIPDLLLETDDGVTLAVDAKYKRYGTYQIAQTDIYQTFLYAYAFHQIGESIPSALILHPADRGTSHLIRLHVRDAHHVTQARLYALGVDIPALLDGLLIGKQPDSLDQVRSVLHHLLNS